MTQETENEKAAWVDDGFRPALHEADAAEFRELAKRCMRRSFELQCELEAQAKVEDLIDGLAKMVKELASQIADIKHPATRLPQILPDLPAWNDQWPIEVKYAWLECWNNLARSIQPSNE